MEKTNLKPFMEFAKTSQENNSLSLSLSLSLNPVFVIIFCMDEFILFLSFHSQLLPAVTRSLA